ncbi:MAG: glycosyltransferase family 2 protein [Solobacterium sp.]|nr:glycosyltransferase family 2 protein [Solobacterium sp.]MBR3349800.1 glycosyltransferase family 2 protein [Solobacterium sp.]
MKEKPCLYIVIPCYNEQEVLPITAPQFLGELTHLIESGKVSDDSRILFVNDGSKDRTWELICEYAEQDPHYTGISQSRNRGHQSTVLAGLMDAKDRCDITISIDCDGQDDISAMDQMVDAYLDGCEIVYGVRSSRETDTWFKRTTAQGFYKLLSSMGVETVYNHADYRLVSSRVLKHFADYEEVNIFLRGMFPLVGFKSTSVYYERHERLAGESHYPLKKMIGLAIDGITSLSVEPIHLIAKIGIVISLIGVIGIIWVFIRAFSGHTVIGWASMMCVIFFLGGMIMLSLGVIGEYVGKTYLETKHRPRYIISERTDEKKPDKE